MAREGQFHHIVLEVSDLERSKEFYENALQLDALGSNVWPEAAPNAFFRTSGGQYVVLVQTAEVKPDGPGVHTNFALAPEDYTVVFDRLSGRECLVIDHRAEERSVGEVSQYFDDPDGHRLQITAYSATAFEVPPARAGKVVAGRVEDFPIGSVTYVKQGKFFLVRLQDGMLALSEVCTHQQCNVLYEKEHYRFWCPCHNRKFTRHGAQFPRPFVDVPPLHTYAIEFLDGQVVVDTDTSIPRYEEDAERIVPVPVAVA